MSRITEHQLDILHRRWRLGSDEAVAADMGLSRNTIRNALFTVRLMLDADDTMQCTYLLRDDLMARDKLVHIRRGSRHRSDVLRQPKAAGGTK